MSNKIAEIVFNQHYAAKMHETDYNLGKRSIKEGPSGKKFLSRHFAADGKEFFKQLCESIESRISKIGKI